MYLRAAVVSHVGRVRLNNEDNYYLHGQIRQAVEEPNIQALYSGAEACTLFAVADGMGGEANGELASLTAVQTLRPSRIGKVRDTVQKSIARANSAICREMERRGRRMGTTLAALYIDDNKAVACNVGDSRIYLLRGGRLSQLSVDHSQAQQLLEAGILTPEEARRHDGRHILTRHLGIFEDEMIIDPAFQEDITLEVGDIFLLCSDGLTDMVEDTVITAALSDGTPERQAQKLVELALANGGRDNVTAMVVAVG